MQNQKNIYVLDKLRIIFFDYLIKIKKYKDSTVFYNKSKSKKNFMSIK